MARVGGLTHKFYRETKGLKISGGQVVKAGTVLTREGHRWKPGKNVNGANHLTAAIDGEVYFTKTKNRFRKVATWINIRSVKAKKSATKSAAKKTVKKTAKKTAETKE